MLIFILAIVGGLFGFGLAIGAKKDVVGPSIAAATTFALVGLVLASPDALGSAFRHMSVGTARFLSLLVAVVGAIWAGHLAEDRRRNVIAWGALGFFLPLIGVVLAAIAPKLDEKGEPMLSTGAA